MFGIPPSIETLKAVVTLLILLAAVYSFIREKLSPDLTALLAMCASAAFAMPIGYQTSMMIYGPGGYRFKDFIRMGIVLDLILAILALWLIPHFWPLIAR
jgi:di/tricarboxylate transporter